MELINSMNSLKSNTLTKMLAIMIFTCGSSAAFAKNTCVDVDKKLATYLDDMYSHSIQSDHYDSDLIYKKNIEIGQLLSNFATKKASLSCQYQRAQQEGLSFLSSDDKKFRVYVWDTATGGSMHDYAGYIQFVDAHNRIHVTALQHKNDEEEPLHSFPTSLFTAKLNGKTHYMLVTTGVFSTMQRSQNLHVYRINKGKLINPKIIKTRTRFTSELGFGFNLFSLIDTNRNRELFEYDHKRQRIRFPVVINNEKYPYGEVTNRWINYKFDGQYFHKVPR